MVEGEGKRKKRGKEKGKKRNENELPSVLYSLKVLSPYPHPYSSHIMLPSTATTVHHQIIKYKLKYNFVAHTVVEMLFRF